ncbi:MAG: glutamine amidotransferase [bacterium]
MITFTANVKAVQAITIALLAGIGTVGLYFWFLRKENTLTATTLTLIRGLIVTTLVLIMMGPAIPVVPEYKGDGPLVLLDRSLSMSLSINDKNSRYDRGKSTVKQILDSKQHQSKIQVLSFGDTLSESIPESAHGNTRLASTLESVHRNVSPERPIVILTDGSVTNTSEVSRIARQISTSGRKIGGFYPQTSRKTEERRILKVSHGARIKRFRKTTITATVETKTTARVLLSSSEKQLDQKTVLPGTGPRTVRLSWKPETLGSLTVSIKEHPKEKVTADNRSVFHQWVDYPEDKRVALAWKNPSWDVRSLMTALESAKDLELVVTDSKLLTKEWRQKQSDKRFDAYILAGLKASDMKENVIDLIADHVDEGSGFLMVGGSNSFGAGNWDDTRLSELLPVRSPSGVVVRNVRSKPELTRTGKFHPVSDVFDTPGLRFPRFNRTDSVKPTGETLLELPTGQNTWPLLVTGRYGNGRTMAVTGHGLWKSIYEGKGTREQLYEFWRILAGQLVPKSSGGLRVSCPSTWYKPGETVECNVRTRGLDSSVEWTATGSGITENGDLPSEGGSIQVHPRKDGIVRFEVSSKKSARTIRDKAFANVNQSIFELKKPKVNPQLVSDIARITGGPHGRFDEAPKKVNKLETELIEKEVEVTYRDIWDQPWLMTALIGFFGLEWTIRRMNGLR